MPEETPPPAPTPTPPAEPPKAPESFTQEDVNRIVGERLARAKAEPPADYADLQAAAARLAEIEAANQTDLERAQSERDALVAERDAAIEKAATTALRATVIAEASKAGAVDPDDVFALLPKNAVTVGDDGLVTGAAEAVKALLEAKPHLVGKRTHTPNGSADGGQQGNPGGVTQLSRADLASMKPHEIEDARVAGRLNDLMSGTSS